MLFAQLHGIESLEEMSDDLLDEDFQKALVLNQSVHLNYHEKTMN